MPTLFQLPQAMEDNNNMKRLLLLISVLPILASAGDGTCTRFTIWNPTTNDTLYHFYRDKGHHGDCWYDYHMIGHRVKFHCKKMVMVSQGDTTTTNDFRGEVSLNPLSYNCVSRW